MARIGFVGLGHMGSPMAINLIRQGHTVTGFDLTASAMKALVNAGGVSANNLPGIAKDQDVIFTMLQTGPQVKSVCLGAEGLFAMASPSTLFIDCSTIDVQSAREIHDAAQKDQRHTLDAPVSGGVLGATEARLTFMVGGSEAAFQKALPYLNVLGKKIIYAGAAGSGQAAKICNNMILGISMIAVSEAFVLGKALGLSHEKLFEVVTNSSGQCWAISNYAPVPGILANVPANNHYQPGFSAAMMLKDLKLSQQSAASVDIDTKLGQEATQQYLAFVEEAHGELDFSAIIKSIEKI